MESDQHISSESFCYSVRLSFETESFIEFDLKFLMSTRWDSSSKIKEELDLDSLLLPSLSLDSHTKSLLFHSSRHQSRYLYAVPCLSVAKDSSKDKHSETTVKQHRKTHTVVQKYLYNVLTKICRKFMKKNGGKLSRKDFSAKEEDFIHEASLRCTKTNLSSVIEEECKS